MEAVDPSETCRFKSLHVDLHSCVLCMHKCTCGEAVGDKIVAVDVVAARIEWVVAREHGTAGIHGLAGSSESHLLNKPNITAGIHAAYPGRNYGFKIRRSSRKDAEE